MGPNFNMITVFVVATLMNTIEAFHGVGVAPTPIVNANIKNWMTPGILIGFLLFALVLLPLFSMIIFFTMYV